MTLGFKRWPRQKLRAEQRRKLAEQRAALLAKLKVQTWHQDGLDSRERGESIPAVPDQRWTMEHREAFLRGFTGR